MQSCKLFYCITKTDDSAATIIIRLLMAVVFIPEGIQKFLFADILGSGRFMQIGIPYPNLLGPFIGVVEIACGVLILVGLFTRLASLVILFEMLLGSIYLLIRGAGVWSFDAKLSQKFCTR